MLSSEIGRRLTRLLKVAFKFSSVLILTFAALRLCVRFSVLRELDLVCKPGRSF
jgi:hypothetical protein